MADTELNTFDLPVSACPYCDVENNSAAADRPPRGPQAGDLTVCASCSQVLVFGDDMRVRKPAPGEEKAAFEESPTLKQRIERLQQLVRRSNRAGGETVDLSKGDPFKPIGYCGLVLPDENEYHGMYIMQGTLDLAEDCLKLLRKTFAEHPEKSLTVTKPNEVDSDLAEELGVLAAALADSMRDEDHVKIMGLIGAIHLVAKEPYFVMIVSRTDDEGRFRLGFDIMRCDTIEEAREIFAKHPEVLKVKLKACLEGW